MRTYVENGAIFTSLRGTFLRGLVLVGESAAVCGCWPGPKTREGRRCSVCTWGLRNRAPVIWRR